MRNRFRYGIRINFYALPKKALPLTGPLEGAFAENQTPDAKKGSEGELPFSV